MLQSLVAYARGAGVDARWSVIDGEPDFFVLTKRIHHKLHGSAGDGGPLGPARARGVRAGDAGQRGAPRGASCTQGDVVLLHDPQTAGMVAGTRRAAACTSCGARTSGSTSPTSTSAQAWDFLLPYLERRRGVHLHARASTRRRSSLDRDLTIIPPSIDVFAAKNQAMTADQVVSILATAGHRRRAGDGRRRRYLHHDGSAGSASRRQAEMDEDERRRSTTGSSSRSRAGTR